jgi:hypothetical protein
VVVPKGALPNEMIGQTIIGEMNQPTLVRVLDDEVDGIFQTALVPLFFDSPLGKGNNRICFGSEGSIYVGKTALSWAGDQGIARVKWNGKSFLSLSTMKATPQGFSLAFSEAIDAKTLSTIKVSSYRYNYFANYGSPKVDEKAMPVKKANLSNDGKSLALDLEALRPGHLHYVDLTGITSPNGKPLLGNKAWYHVIKVPR